MFDESDWRKAPYVEAFMMYYLVGKSKQTVKVYTKYLRGFIQFCCMRWQCIPQDLDFTRCTIHQIGNVKIYDEITQEPIRDYLLSLTQYAQTQAPTPLGKYFNYLVDLGVMTKNPVHRLPVKIQREPVQGLSLREIELLAHRLRAIPEPYRFAFVVQLSAGLRISEVACLRARDLEQTHDGKWEITICREAMKARREWRLPLPNVTAEVDSLMNWRQTNNISSEFLVTYRNGEPMREKHLRMMLKKLTADLKLSKSISTHDLRRAYATLMNEYVENPDVLVNALRHQVDSFEGHRVTRGYVRRPQHEDIARWMETLPVVRLADSLAAVWLKNKSGQP